LTTDDGFSLISYAQGFGNLTEVRRDGKPLGMVLWNVLDPLLEYARYFTMDRTEIPAEFEQSQVMRGVIAGAVARRSGMPSPPGPSQAEPQT
jgi:hypothetical protein